MALGLLGLTFAFECLRPVLTVGRWGTFTNVELAMIALVVVWGLGCAVDRRLPRFPRLLGAAAIIWLLAMTLSALLAPAHRATALRFTLKVALGALVGWAAYDGAHTSDRRAALGKAFALGGLAVALFGLAEAAGAPPVERWLAPFKAAPTWVGEFRRVSATLPYATITGAVLELTAPFWLAWTLSAPSRPRRWLVAGGLLVTVTALVLTLSRAAVLALLAAMAVWGLAVGRRHQNWGRSAAVACGVVGGVAAWALLTTPDLVWRLRTETDRNWYMAEYKVPAVVTVQTGERRRVSVTVINRGLRAWAPNSPYPFALSYHLRRPDGTVVTYDGPRTRLRQPLSPGHAVTLQAEVAAPPAPGQYVVEWDVVREGLMWLSWKGSPTAQTRLVVQGAPLSIPASWQPTPPPDAPHVAEPVPERPELWRAAWRMAQERPLLGYGPDTFRLRYGPYLGYARWHRGVHANNLYLELLAGTGWLGLAAFGLFVWRMLGAVEGTIKNADHVWDHALAVTVIAWLVHGLADAFLAFTPTFVLFWLVVGLLAAGHEAATAEE